MISLLIHPFRDVFVQRRRVPWLPKSNERHLDCDIPGPSSQFYRKIIRAPIYMYNLYTIMICYVSMSYSII